MGRVLILGWVCLSFLLASPQVLAQSDTDTASLAANCSGCHDSSANASSGSVMGNLSTLSRAEFLQKLVQYQNSQVAGSAMHRIAKGISAQEAQQLADFFTSTGINYGQ